MRWTFRLLCLLALAGSSTTVGQVPTIAPEVPAPAEPKPRLSEPDELPADESETLEQKADQPHAGLKAAEIAPASTPVNAKSVAEQTRTAVTPPETFTERFPSGKIKIQRVVSQDAKGNYLNHGAWVQRDERGQLIAEGQFQHGERHGVWKRWYQANEAEMFSQPPYKQFSGPFFSQADFEHGQLNGVWIITDKQRRTISRIEFTAGRRHGTATWWYPNGKRQHEIPYRDGIIDGTAIHYTSEGKVASREVYQAGCRLSPETTQYADGKKKSSGTVLGPRQVVSTPDDWWNVIPAEFTSEGVDERHGPWVFWYPDGRKQFEGEYVHDVPTGKFTWWYPNGQVASAGKFQDGQQDGPWVWWHANGQKSIEGQFAAGVATGDWLSWRENGEPIRALDLASDKAQLAVDNAPEPDDIASETADAASPNGKEPEAINPDAATPDEPEPRRIKPKMEIGPPPIPRTKITITEIPGGVTLKFKAVEGTKRR